MSKPSTTAEQLRTLMQSHIKNDAAKPAAVLKTPVSVAAPTAASSTVEKPVVTIPATTPSRYSLRLLRLEIEKINGIIQNTLEQTGERVTLTDVLRAGIGRVGDSTPIMRHEIVYLRQNDGRRHKQSPQS